MMDGGEVSAGNRAGQHPHLEPSLRCLDEDGTPAHGERATTGQAMEDTGWTGGWVVGMTMDEVGPVMDRCAVTSVHHTSWQCLISHMITAPGTSITID